MTKTNNTARLDEVTFSDLLRCNIVWTPTRKTKTPTAAETRAAHAADAFSEFGPCRCAVCAA